MSVLGHFPTRLYWHGKTGGATHDGVHVDFRGPHEKPDGLQWAEVDWAPDAVAECRDRDCDASRPLESSEVKQIRAYLEGMAKRDRS